MQARKARPRRTKAVTLKLSQAEFAALERAAGPEDLGPFCRQIVLNHLNLHPDPIQLLQLRQHAATREILKRWLLSLPGVDPFEINRIESNVSCIEEALAQGVLHRFSKELENKEADRLRRGLNCDPDAMSSDKDAGSKNEAKCVAIVRKLAELANKNPQKIVGLGCVGNQAEVRVGSAYTEISLPSNPGYKAWCFFVDDFYKALHSGSQFYWKLPEDSDRV